MRFTSNYNILLNCMEYEDVCSFFLYYDLCGLLYDLEEKKKLIEFIADDEDLTKINL